MPERDLSNFDANQVIKKVYEDAPKAALRIFEITEDSTSNTWRVQKNAVTTTASKLVFPCDVKQVVIYHKTDNADLWYGEASTVAVEGSNSAPMERGDVLVADINSADDNTLYAISSTGTINVYIIGLVQE
jgi:hypothetical protein